MDLLAQYRDDDEDSDDGGDIKPVAQVQAAPEIDTVGLALADNTVVRVGEQAKYQDPTRRVVYENLKYEELYAPVVGPSNAHEASTISVGGEKNHPLGYVHSTHISSYNFDKQFSDFHSSGVAEDPRDKRVLTLDKGRPTKVARTGSKSVSKKNQKKEEEKNQSADDSDEDPFEWRGSKTPWKERSLVPTEYTEEQKKILEEAAEEKKRGKNAEDEEAGGKAADKQEKREDKSFFHGKSERDYAGRSWVEPRKGLKQDNDTCYIPKRCIHTWSGHSKGTNAIRFFPGSGHLLLSAGLDAKVKIWDVGTTGKCMRTYLGHEKGVRDICFTNDGRKFLTTGYDKRIKLWDTETGQVVRTLSSGKMLGYCVKFHPDEDKQNLVLAGCSDKKIYQFDTETGDIVQEYNEHLGAVNSITFLDENRRFVSSSDDKSLRVWDFGIPVQIKYIADPTMHSMPSVCASPDGSHFIGQSLDNTIMVYSTKERFKINRKKTFKGHNNAGYACQVNFSPDGRFVFSGDGEGRCFFWDWKTTRIFRKMKCHQGVCMGAEWHPLEKSKVATCGWDGLIKYWD